MSRRSLKITPSQKRKQRKFHVK